MNEIWSGSIFTDDPTAALQDIQLWSATSLAQSPFGQTANLHFLSLVHVPSIPLYLAAGPSLHVSTDDESTAAWLSQSLLGRPPYGGQKNASLEPWWASLGKQSEQGILLKVEEEGANHGISNQVTEVLLYAASCTGGSSLPTPPASSSPGPAQEALQGDHGARAKEVNVYALPLSSKVIDEASNAMPVISPSPEEAVPACFLPSYREQSHTTLKAHETRQSLSSLFDEASQKRRKLKGRGGERVAQTMAGLDRPASQDSTVAETSKESQRQSHPHTQATGTRKGLSRAATPSSIPRSECTRRTSRTGLLANGKRSSLHRVESAISPCDSPAFSDADDSCGNQNRAALTKIVMAGMRLYGLQQKKKTSKNFTNQGLSTTVASDGATLSTKQDEEYKLVYHQSFKAATFAFRRQISSQVIPQEMMRDVVDQFLSLFCNDPLSVPGLPNDDMLAGGGTQGSESNGAFDLPSLKTLSPAAPTAWTTPTIKKR